MSEPSTTTILSTPRLTNFFRVASLALIALLAITPGQAEAAREHRRVAVADPYLDVPMGGYQMLVRAEVLRAKPGQNPPSPEQQPAERGCEQPSPADAERGNERSRVDQLLAGAGQPVAGRLLLYDALEGVDDDGWLMRGGSAVAGPDGEWIVPPVFDREQILVASIDPQRRDEEAMALGSAVWGKTAVVLGLMTTYHIAAGTAM